MFYTFLDVDITNSRTSDSTGNYYYFDDDGIIQLFSILLNITPPPKKKKMNDGIYLSVAVEHGEIGDDDRDGQSDRKHAGQGA